MRFLVCQNETQRTLEDVIEAMASLFPDKLFHVGCDETSQIGNCTLESVFVCCLCLVELIVMMAVVSDIASLEREVIDFVTSLGKVPVGWEEVLFESKAVSVIVCMLGVLCSNGQGVCRQLQRQLLMTGHGILLLILFVKDI